MSCSGMRLSRNLAEANLDNEGDSARLLALVTISMVGRGHYSVGQQEHLRLLATDYCNP
jgi:hypothetical protein